MSETSKIQLKFSSIKNVPIQNYQDYFTFVVNGKEFKTSKLVSDLLSPVICQNHITDPTFSIFYINTKQQGDFSHILSLINFQELSTSQNESEFIEEVIEQLGSTVYLKEEKADNIEITNSNVFNLLKKHERYANRYLTQLSQEIEYVSSHFSTLAEEEEMKTLSYDTLLKIIQHESLKLEDEDQLMKFVNILYKQNKEFETFYEEIFFSNVSTTMIEEFVNTIELNDLTTGTWKSICKRLVLKPSQNEYDQNVKQTRYRKETNEQNSNKEDEISNKKSFLYEEGREMNGIIKYLTDQTGSNIHDNGTIQLTSKYPGSDSPRNLLDFNHNNYYCPGSYQKDAWICFDFKDREIEITNYSIKSACGPGYVKNWVIEISKDGQNWKQIDEERDYSGLNRNNIIKTFSVESNEYSRYCRFRHTGDYWSSNSNCLRIGSIEFYGHIKSSK